MKSTLRPALIAAVLCAAAPAYPEENCFASVSDGGTQVVNVSAAVAPARVVAVQCPGQVVSYRAGSATEPHDGGRSVQLDFIKCSDPYRIPLKGGRDRLTLKNTDGGLVDCCVATVDVQ